MMRAGMRPPFGGHQSERKAVRRLLIAALGLGGSINYISAEEGAERDRQPGDEMRAWNL
jgi:hypothetical protein